MNVQKLEGFKEGRPETGPMQFGDDWPGIFIRGDTALAYAMYLKMLLDKQKDDMAWPQAMYLKSLLDYLTSCRVGG